MSKLFHSVWLATLLTISSFTLSVAASVTSAVPTAYDEETDPTGFSWVGSIERSDDSTLSGGPAAYVIGTGILGSLGAGVVNTISAVDNLGFKALGILGSDQVAALGPLGVEFQELGVASRELGVAGVAAEGEESFGFTFRGDAQSPDVIFNQGFSAKGTSTDLYAHALDSSSPPSAFISTSTSPAVAAGFANNVYVVRPVNGINVNQALGPLSPFPGESEIAVPWQIGPGIVRGVTLPQQGVSILNPNWKP